MCEFSDGNGNPLRFTNNNTIRHRYRFQANTLEDHNQIETILACSDIKNNW